MIVLGAVAAAASVAAVTAVVVLVRRLRTATARLDEVASRLETLEDEPASTAVVDARPATLDNNTLTDDHTGLFSEQYFNVALDARLSAARRHLRPVAVVLLEVVQGLAEGSLRESDPRVHQQLETTLADQRRLQDNIAELDNRMQRADLQLDSSLAALGTVYSQILLVGSKEVDSDRAERLSADIASEVTSLQDVVDSINEVYDYRTLGSAK